MDSRRQFIKMLREKDIVLFGAGSYARQFYRDFGGELNVRFCISNDDKEKVFSVDGREVCPVVRVNTMKMEQGQFVILCAERYQEMEIQLKDMGYRNGGQYISSHLVRILFSDKKIAIFYGVCYIRAIYNCMIASEAFRKEFEAFCWLEYRSMEPEEYDLFSFLLPLCRLFIHSAYVFSDKVRRGQAYLSRLSKECRTVSVPLISFNGYHPRTEGGVGELNPYDVTSNKTYYGTFMVPDCNMNRLIDEGKQYSEIIKIVSDIEFYDRTWLEENFHKGIARLRVAERLSDIKLVDFLLENHGKERLFLNETHISNVVVVELAGRILEFIGLERILPKERLWQERLLYTTEVPLYPSVIDKLNLQVYRGIPTYRLFTFGDEVDVTFEAYVERYCEYCRSIKGWIRKGYFPA